MNAERNKYYMEGDMKESYDAAIIVSYRPLHGVILSKYGGKEFGKNLE